MDVSPSGALDEAQGESPSSIRTDHDFGETRWALMAMLGNPQ
jgi:hypothetical protein